MTVYRIFERDMRIDKFLKNSRLIKRRTIAKEICEQGRVMLNNKIAKPGSEVAVGDVIAIRFGTSEAIVRVTEILDTAKKDKSAEMYEMIERREYKVFEGSNESK